MTEKLRAVGSRHFTLVNDDAKTVYRVVPGSAQNVGGTMHLQITDAAGSVREVDWNTEVELLTRDQ